MSKRWDRHPGSGALRHQDRHISVYDFLLEIILRKRHLLLSFNLDYEDCDDPSPRASDATERAFIVHATESGGVLFNLMHSSQFGAAIHIARQAYEKVSE